MSGTSTKFRKVLVANSARKLFDEVSEQDHAEWFERKCQSDEQFAKEVMETCEMLADIQGLETDTDVRTWLDEAVESKVVSSPKRIWPWLSAAAMILLAVVLLPIQPWFDENGEAEELARYVTRVGEQKEVLLSDGTEIILNTGTQLLVDFRADSRRVLLERGEANFAVSADSERPFSVVMGDKAVSVLGTEFVLRKEPEKFQLAVTEGVVVLHDVDEQIFAAAPAIGVEDRETLFDQRKVSAGWVVTYSAVAESLMAEHKVDLDKFTSWTRGVIHFSGEPLSKVVYELNRYTGKKILIEEAELMGKPINASLRVDRVSSALKGLEKSYSLKVTHHFDRIVISNN
ncbi:FecR domain-containing protein [Porticoccaceae bacterium LTM1]|nr:FecR domain-containing protein [Porticoccaceae bacterium LTM1]